MKKTNLYFAIAMATTVSSISLNAAHAAASSDVFSGLHITGALGHNRLESAFKTNLLVTDRFVLEGKSNSVSNRLSGSLAVDYWACVKNIYIGVEASGMYAGQEVQSNRTYIDRDIAPLPFAEKLKHNYALGLTVLAGKSLNENVMVYGGLGIDCGQFTYRAETNDDRLEKKKHLMAFRPTTGVRVKLSSKMLLDVRYSYAFYQSLKMNKAFVAPQTGLSGRVSPRVSTVSLGISIKI